jgi:hypothetical protein
MPSPSPILSGFGRFSGGVAAGRLVPLLAAVLLAALGLVSIRSDDPGGTAAPGGEGVAMGAAGGPAAAPDGLLRVHAMGGRGICAVSVTATPRPLATIGLEVEAPCHQGAALELTQGALTVTEKLDVTGRLETVLPALSEAPVISVRVPEAEPVTLQAWVGDFDAVHRAVLRWRGEAGPEVLALEGTPGWSALGNARIAEGHRALVYTAPIGTTPSVSVAEAMPEVPCVDRAGAKTQPTGPARQEFADAVPDCVPSAEVGAVAGSPAPFTGAGG